jgi:hypothetical protein
MSVGATSIWPYLISLAGVGVAALATLASWLNSGSQRAHDRDMAHDSRVFEARQTIYQDLLAYAHTHVLIVARTEPMMGFKGEPPPPSFPAESETLNLQARVLAFGSSEVEKAVDAFHTSLHKFHAKVGTLRYYREHPEAGETATWEELEECRADVTEAVKTLNRAVAHDLGVRSDESSRETP